jgi:threonyl-tRNA synthetase
MAHPVVSSDAAQIPALGSLHTDIVSGKEPNPQKDKKSKTAPVPRFPLEVRRTDYHCWDVTHMFSHQLQPPPDFFQHRIQIFEKLKAEYDAFVQGLPVRSSTLAKSS